MTDADFLKTLEVEALSQLGLAKVGYLLGAGSSYMDDRGYPLAFQLWEKIKGRIKDGTRRAEIQEKLDAGANGIEHALDLLDQGLPEDGPHRHLVTGAIADLFHTINPVLDFHVDFVRRVAKRSDGPTKIFSLNYDPLVERAAEHAQVRLCDGFLGHEHAFFEPNVFNEWACQIRGTHKGKQFDIAATPLHLFKLHGSVGWYESSKDGLRRGAFSVPIPEDAKRLMIPPQRRKANDTATAPYASIWSAYRACLVHDAAVNRLATIGYGLLDEHVNAVIESALARSNFSLLVFAKELSDTAWERWSRKNTAIIVTAKRCSIWGERGPGHPELWKFEHLAGKV